MPGAGNGRKVAKRKSQKKNRGSAEDYLPGSKVNKQGTPVRLPKTPPHGPKTFFIMIDFRNQAVRIKYFALPLLAFSILLLWNQWRISNPDTALNTARQYLEAQFPGAKWELGKLASVGESLGKKWRLEFSSLQKDGRRME